MAHIASFNVSDVPSVSWKNGGGSTKEIAAFPPNAGLNDFVWRVSVAEISQPSAYSIFPGIDRTQVLISGVSLTLRNQAGIEKRLLAFEPFLFVGEEHWHATPDGVCQMLNVMTSRAGVLNVLEVTHGDFKCVGHAGHHVVAVVQGEYLSDDGSQRFIAGDFLQLDFMLGEAFALTASSDAVIISIKISLLNK